VALVKIVALARMRPQVKAWALRKAEAEVKSLRKVETKCLTKTEKLVEVVALAKI